MLLIKLIDDRLKTLKGKQGLAKEILKSYDMKKNHKLPSFGNYV